MLTKNPISPSVSSRLRLAIGVPDDQVVLARVAIQQDLERRQQSHELGHPFLATQRFEPFPQMSGQHQRLVRTPKVCTAGLG